MSDLEKLAAIGKVIDPDAWHSTLPADGCGIHWMRRRKKAIEKAAAIFAMVEAATLEQAARKADDFAMLADATFLSWQERARQNLDGMDVAGGCAIGMAHQARCIASAIRTPIPSSRREGGE